MGCASSSPDAVSLFGVATSDAGAGGAAAAAAAASRQALSSTFDVFAHIEGVPLSPGTFMEAYVMGPELGKGNYSVVHKCTKKATNEVLAVKIVEKSKVADQEDRDALVFEIQVLHELRHPNIIRCVLRRPHAHARGWRPCGGRGACGEVLLS